MLFANGPGSDMGRKKGKKPIETYITRNNAPFSLFRSISHIFLQNYLFKPHVGTVASDLHPFSYQNHDLQTLVVRLYYCSDEARGCGNYPISALHFCSFLSWRLELAPTWYWQYLYTWKRRCCGVRYRQVKVVCPGFRQLQQVSCQ